MTSRLIGARAFFAAWCLALAFLISSSSGPAGSVRAQGPDIGTDAQRESGKALYLKNCSQCHGEKGDGEGYAAPHLRPRPRDFTGQKPRAKEEVRHQ